MIINRLAVPVTANPARVGVTVNEGTIMREETMQEIVARGATLKDVTDALQATRESFRQLKINPKDKYWKGEHFRRSCRIKPIFDSWMMSEGDS
jgi:hypothetical protein